MADKETGANGEENKKSKLVDGKINEEQSAKKQQEEMWDEQKGLRGFIVEQYELGRA